MTEYDESAFMADLLLGNLSSKGFRQYGEELGGSSQNKTIEKLEHITDRLRAQTIHIVAACRHWKRQYAREDDPLVQRYLRYEGALCRQDLMQHWMLYRRAMVELHAPKGAGGKADVKVA